MKPQELYKKFNIKKTLVGKHAPKGYFNDFDAWLDDIAKNAKFIPKVTLFPNDLMLNFETCSCRNDALVKAEFKVKETVKFDDIMNEFLRFFTNRIAISMNDYYSIILAKLTYC